MRVVDVIEAKKDGRSLDEESIRGMVKGYVDGTIPDYQMSSFLMAVAIRGMSIDETICLTRAMVDSGNILDLSSIPGVKLDKHSSGGVGDKVTLALVPILAAAGVPMAKMSGHGLGHTGGTLDKLESIPGFRSELSEAQIIDQVRRVGACICAQTDTLAPADRSMYALRDVTGSVASIPLIASSIMSKKIACGADVILLDIKVGSGAFMKNVDDARELAQTCLEIAKAYGKKMSVFLTDMNQPLGRAVGNRIEVNEIAALLNPSSSGSSRLRDLTLELCREGMRLVNINVDPQAIIKSGSAFAKLEEIITAQGGKDWHLSTREKVPSTGIVADKSGYIAQIDALEVGNVAASLGAGRQKKGDSIDYSAGVWLAKVVGDRVHNGDDLGGVISSDESLLQNAAKRLWRTFVITDDPPEPTPLFLNRLSSESA